MKPAPPPARPTGKMTFNLRSSEKLTLAHSFQDRGVALQIFSSFDGGGWGGYILEFERREDLQAYVDASGATSARCWIEHADGRIEYLNLKDLSTS